MQKSCEASLSFYRDVAEQVRDQVDVNLPVVERVRLGGGAASNKNQQEEDVVQYYQHNADIGDTNAQLVTGQLHYTGGHGVQQDFDVAQRYFVQAARGGDGQAMAYLGEMYAGGLGVAQDNQTARSYYEKGIAKKVPAAYAGLGLMYRSGQGVAKDEAKAFELFTRAAKAGNAQGQLQLAYQYYDGLGTKRDYKKATTYFQLAAQQGHVLAMYELGRMHATGSGTSRDCKLATGLFKNVAERGHWSRTFEHALERYEQGQYDQALIQYLWLAELGYEMGQYNAAYILDEHHGELQLFQERGAYARAYVNWRKSANQGEMASRVMLGDYHFYGRLNDPDAAAAANEYRTAADASHPQALWNLGWMHEQGKGLPVDLHLAKRFYDAAAASSNEAALPASLSLLLLRAKLLWSDLAGSGPAGGEGGAADGDFLDQYEDVLLTALVGLLSVVMLARQVQVAAAAEEAQRRAAAAQAAAEAEAAAAAPEDGGGDA